jgi:uncharacterized membrane protein YqjE
MKIPGIVRDASGALLDHAALHAELLRVEWAEEKLRLHQLLSAAAVGFAFLLALLIGFGAVLLSLAWDTGLRLPTVAALMVLYALGAAMAWRQYRAQATRGEHSFAASRSEIAADLELLRSHL